MKQRKHRVVVDVTLNKPVTQKAATMAVALLLGEIDLDAKPIYTTGNLYVDRLRAKQYSRVFAADLSRIQQPLPLPYGGHR